VGANLESRVIKTLGHYVSGNEVYGKQREDTQDFEKGQKRGEERTTLAQTRPFREKETKGGRMWKQKERHGTKPGKMQTTIGRNEKKVPQRKPPCGGGKDVDT